MSHPQLTEEQISVFQEVFALYDIDEDGTISSSDIPKVMKCLGCDFTKEELDKNVKKNKIKLFIILKYIIIVTIRKN